MSKSTNDISARWWSGPLAIVGSLGLVLWGTGLVGEMFRVQRPGVVLLCAVLLLMSSGGLLSLYGWVWGRSGFDLVPRR